jgi:hypothetical protein
MATCRLVTGETGVHHLIHEVAQLSMDTYILSVVLTWIGLAWLGCSQQRLAKEEKGTRGIDERETMFGRLPPEFLEPTT